MKPGISTTASFLILMLLGWSSLKGMEPTRIPALQITTLDGQVTKTSDLPNKGHWLLIYVTPGSHFCLDALQLLKKEDYPKLAGNAVIIVGGSIQDAKTLQSRFPDLATTAWFADPGQDVFRGLKLHGLPSIIGVTQQTMQWAAIGAADPIAFKSMLNSWLDQVDPRAKP